MIHVHQCFNAVGHGTFFNGLAFDERSNSSFSWIYDCGSKRKTRLEQELSDLECWHQWPEEVDLLVLSHFDDDHVNGVERLLSSRRVRILALPYMDVGHSLACAASIGTEPSSVSTAMFKLDPVNWLQSRGLAGQVDTLLLVQGGSSSNNDTPVNGEPLPLPGEPEENRRRRDSRPDTDVTTSFQGTRTIVTGHSGNTNTATVPRVVFWNHRIAAASCGSFLELMFFNATQPDLFRTNASNSLLARRSGQPISVVQADVDVVVQRYRLQDLRRSPKKGWRDALRAVYVKHFGSSSQQRNNISLCLLIRPLASEVGSCSLGLFGQRNIYSPTPPSRVSIIEKAGTLLLGDLRIDKATLAEMQVHFGAVRWADLSTVQVPHHGSQHSWESGVAKVFRPERFIQCVPYESSHHPHKNVSDDLRGADVFHADYKAGVVIDYHFPLFKSS
ncbi:TPA: hypothetical protein ACGY8I_001200 [Aeromonas hydrophila]